MERILFWHNDERYLVKDMDGLVETYREKGKLENFIHGVEAQIRKFEDTKSLIEDDIVQQVNVDEDKAIPKEKAISDLRTRIEDTSRFLELLKSKAK